MQSGVTEFTWLIGETNFTYLKHFKHFIRHRRHFSTHYNNRKKHLSKSLKKRGGLKRSFNNDEDSSEKYYAFQKKANSNEKFEMFIFIFINFIYHAL